MMVSRSISSSWGPYISLPRDVAIQYLNVNCNPGSKYRREIVDKEGSFTMTSLIYNDVCKSYLTSFLYNQKKTK